MPDLPTRIWSYVHGDWVPAEEFDDATTSTPSSDDIADASVDWLDDLYDRALSRMEKNDPQWENRVGLWLDSINEALESGGCVVIARKKDPDTQQPCYVIWSQKNKL